MTETTNMRLQKDSHAADPIPDSAWSEVQTLLESGDLFRYTAQKDAPVTLLEREFAEMMGSRYALAVASCSAALFLSLKALDLPRGTKVLIPAFTFAAVPSAVVHADCVPVLVECGANYRVDMADFAAKLTSDIGAVLISHMRGHTSDMDAIMAHCSAANIPVIEDAAHSLGTTWRGQKIGTIGRVGCFSFQSYKLVNAGEGGIMITDDPDLIARATIMSGAYEQRWRKHDIAYDAVAKWQNKLPLYNTRLSNLAAVVARAQLPHVPHRVTAGRKNHDYLAKRLNSASNIDVPEALDGESRAPDSIQFNLVAMSDAQVDDFVQIAAAGGVSIQVFGKSQDNARAFWNWQFLENTGDLPQTREMLMRACDVRLPVRLTEAELDAIADVIFDALEKSCGPSRTYGT